MTIHYHGTPITPNAELHKLGGRNFCVSHADPRQVKACHSLGQSVMLDNGAFSRWRTGKGTDWPGYYRWAEQWLNYPTTWAVIPDVIDGDVEKNDALIRQWPFATKGAPVWHLHEPIERLCSLAEEWPRVCLGSSGAYSTVGSPGWHRRMEAAMNALCGSGPVPVWLHMLRGMALCEGPYPFASVDSTDLARSHKRPYQTVTALADRWDVNQCPAVWETREHMSATTTLLRLVSRSEQSD